MANATDRRPSDALNIFYGNRTVTPTLENKWAKYGAFKGYFYGDGIEALFSAIGYMDFGLLAHPLFTEFEIALPFISEPNIKIASLGEFLSKWMRFSLRDLDREQFKSGDALILVDIDKADPLYALAQNCAHDVIRSGGKVFVVIEENATVPINICSLDRTVGVKTPAQMPFLVAAFDQSLAWFAPERVFVVGSSLRTITTALSAFDHLLFHQVGKANKHSVASRVIVHKHSQILNTPAANMFDICSLLKILATYNVLPSARFGPDREAVYLTAVQS